jgi:HSP20 family protein
MNGRATWDPWHEMRRLQRDMEHLFADATPGWRWPLSGEYPPINLTRSDDGLVLEALCPGVDRASLDVRVVGDAATVRGERKQEVDVQEERYHRRERPLGAFSRTLSVGERLDADGAAGTYTNGILRVQLRRAPATEPKKIPIQS